jgi:SAM-dependent methyltransferase
VLVAIASHTRRECNVPEWRPNFWLTDNDRGRSRTAYSLGDLRLATDAMRHAPVKRFLDIGCGYGGLSALVGDYLGAEEVFGLDIDPRVEDEAAAKGVAITIQDASSGELPYADGYIDAIMTLGMMDYLVSFDGLIREMNRVLVAGGLV